MLIIIDRYLIHLVWSKRNGCWKDHKKDGRKAILQVDLNLSSKIIIILFFFEILAFICVLITDHLRKSHRLQQRQSRFRFFLLSFPPFLFSETKETSPMGYLLLHRRGDLCDQCFSESKSKVAVHRWESAEAKSCEIYSRLSIGHALPFGADTTPQDNA